MKARIAASKFLANVAVVIAMSMFAQHNMGQSVPSLINYQGRLTDQTGAPLAGGAYTLQFQLWDSPTGTNKSSGGDLIWGQQYSNIAIQSNGVFNVILGAPGGSNIPNATPNVNNLAYAFSGSNCFLGVTVVVSNNISVGIPIEILPRQQLLSVPFAINAGSAVNSSSAINASNAVTASIAASVANGIVGLSNLAPRMVLTNSTPQSPTPVGGLAISGPCANSAASAGNLAALTVTINTTGRPVFVGLMAADGQDLSELNVSQTGSANYLTCSFTIQRGTATICTYGLTCIAGNPNYAGASIPSSALHIVDVPPGPGTYTYTVGVNAGTGQGTIYGARLFAFEF